MQTIGADVWNGSESEVNNFAHGGGRNITFPIGLRAGGVINLDRHSFVILDANHIVQYISPQATHYTRRLDVHAEEMHEIIEALIGTTSVEDVPEQTPDTFRLLPNSPNPFSEGTTIRVDAANPVQNRETELAVYDLLGRKVATVFSGRLNAGQHIFEWRGRDARGQRMPAGIYFLALRSRDFLETRRMLLLAR